MFPSHQVFLAVYFGSGFGRQATQSFEFTCVAYKVISRTEAIDIAIITHLRPEGLECGFWIRYELVVQRFNGVLIILCLPKIFSGTASIFHKALTLLFDQVPHNAGTGQVVERMA